MVSWSTWRKKTNRTKKNFRSKITFHSGHVLTQLFCSRQSGAQVADGEWADAKRIKKQRQLGPFGPEWASQPEELKEEAKAIMLTSYLLDFVSDKL